MQTLHFVLFWFSGGVRSFSRDCLPECWTPSWSTSSCSSSQYQRHALLWPILDSFLPKYFSVFSIFFDFFFKTYSNIFLTFSKKIRMTPQRLPNDFQTSPEQPPNNPWTTPEQRPGMRKLWRNAVAAELHGEWKSLYINEDASLSNCRVVVFAMQPPLPTYFNSSLWFVCSSAFGVYMIPWWGAKGQRSQLLKELHSKHVSSCCLWPAG